MTGAARRELNVAIVTRFPADPGAPRGGVESVSVNLVAALAATPDLQVHVVTTDPDCRVRRVDGWNGVTVHRLPRLGRRVLTDAVGSGRRQISTYLKELAPDVVHSHDVYGLMVKGLDLPRVFTIHGFIHADTWVSGGRFCWIRSRVWRVVETGGWADQPHIISISPYVRERLRGIAKGVIHDIDNPISSRFFGIQRREEPGRIFSAAWISRRKNTLGLLRGFERLLANGVKAQLRLAGAAHEGAYFTEVRHFIERHGLQQHVKLLGRIDYEDVAQELSKASVFVLASLEENSPMGIEEAMAAGVPVVTSNRCGMPYMVRDGESGYLVDPQDPDDIALRLRQVLESQDLRSAMSAKACEIARDRFHPCIVAQRTRDVYLRAIHDYRRGSASAAT